MSISSAWPDRYTLCITLNRIPFRVLGVYMQYWIGVGSKDHVKKGAKEGFSQLCHGKSQPLKRMNIGDWIIYYSPKEIFQENTPCQKFTAIGKVIGSEVYAFEMHPGFIPFRRDINFVETSEVNIRPLIEKLSFIKNKKSWGYPFRYGHIEIGKEDFELIAKEMLGFIPDKVFPTNSS